VIQSYIQFAEGRQFTFQYSIYGETTRVNPSTGGEIEYDYGTGITAARLVLRV